MTEQQPSSTDWNGLRRRALAAVEAHGRRHWTDYNVHDPGITLLEHLCWAVTDVGYRTAHPIEDLLTPPKGKARDPWRTAEFPPNVILPCRPVTEIDARKALMDVPGVRNAWLAKHDGEVVLYDRDDRKLVLVVPTGHDFATVTLRGSWAVDIEIDPASGFTTTEVLARVRARLHAMRNLCEDAAVIRAVDTDRLGVCIDIEVAPDTDVETVVAGVRHRFERFVSPGPTFLTLSQAIARGQSIEEVFRGPLPTRGFLHDDDVEAARRRCELHVSDLVRIAMEAVGVTAVRKLLLTSYDALSGAVLEPGARWVLPLNDKRTVSIDWSRSVVRVFRGVLIVSIDESQVEANQERLRQEQTPPPIAAADLALAVPTGRHRDPAKFFSVQNELPQNYGIGHAGLPDSASVQRQAQAMQLAAYLTILEQLIADELAQIAHLGDLFAIEGASRTRFTQLPEDIDDLDKLVGDRAVYSSLLESASEDDARFLSRRHAFVDHLLARFAETPDDHASIARFVAGVGSARESLRRKERWLKHLPALAHERGGGADQQFDAAAPAPRFGDPASGVSMRNESGLGFRIRILMGLDDWGDDADAASIRRRFEVECNEGGSWRYHVRDETGAKVLDGASSFSHEADVETAIAEFVRAARIEARSGIVATLTGRFAVTISDELGHVLARSTVEFDSELEARTALEDLRSLFADAPPLERCFVVEHLLLRPRAGTSGMLPVCSEDEPECPGFDPYSFRVTVLLPAWPSRFDDMQLRRFAEDLVRRHSPSHVFVKICWLAAGVAEDFGTKHDAWWRALRGDASVLATAQDEFVHLLLSVRSSYPQARLAACDAPEASRPFVLDNTILGGPQGVNDDPR